MSPRAARPRPKRPRGRPVVGELLELEAGPVAHGGHVVGRVPAAVPELGGTVVFVRHALPGELVEVRLTEGSVGDRFLRGDAVRVLRASPDRVQPPCPYAGPGLCGGCDFQHVEPGAQRRLKEAVIAEQLRRVAGEDRHVPVVAVPGDEDGLRWRSRLRMHRRPDGRLGLRAHRSHRVVPVDDCRVAAPGARVLVEGEGPAAGTVTEHVRGRSFEVASDGFWQAHVGAPAVLVDAVLAGAALRGGETVLDLYAGVGLFSAFLAEVAGPGGRVVAVEGDRDAAVLAAHNLSGLPGVEVWQGPVAEVLSAAEGPEGGDVVVLDPPRAGAGRGVLTEVARRAPRTVVLVACDPASFARDVSLLRAEGYDWGEARGYDLFPMTHHVEVVAALHRGATQAG